MSEVYNLRGIITRGTMCKHSRCLVLSTEDDSTGKSIREAWVTFVENHNRKVQQCVPYDLSYSGERSKPK